jgi:hypothetical protein
MKPDLTALRALRLPLLALAASLLIGAAIVVYSAAQLKQAQDHLGQLKTAQAMSQKKVLTSGDENQLILRYSADYQRLARQGFVGSESRINWLDALRTTNQDLKLFGVEYAIEPQQASASAAEPGAQPVAKGLQLRQTRMKLRLQLLHEGDLMRFFDHLTAQNVGLFSIEDCAMQRISEVAQSAVPFLPSRVQPYLQAECQLAWFTVDLAEGKQ